MALIVLAAMLLMGVAAFLWVRRSSVRPASTSWVAAKEGLIEFSPAGTRCVPWDSVTDAVRTPHGVELILVGRPVVHEYPLHGARFEPLDPPLVLADGMLADAPPDRFVAMIQCAASDEEARRRLPTFEFPEGPPEAVLAGVADLPGSEGGLG